MPGLWYKLRRLDGRGHFKALFTFFSRRALHKDIGTCSIFKLNIGVLIYYIMINYGQKYHVRNSLMQILLLIVWPPSLHKVKNIVTINFRCPIDFSFDYHRYILERNKPHFLSYLHNAVLFLSIRTRRKRDITFSMLCKYTTTCNASVFSSFNCIVVNDLNSGTLRENFLNTLTSAMKMEVISV